MVNSPLIRPYLLEGVALGGGTLDSHEINTLPETNSEFAPENNPLEVWSFRAWKPSFLGAFAVSFRECIQTPKQFYIQSS